MALGFSTAQILACFVSQSKGTNTTVIIYRSEIVNF
jgi:hypothetical protein